MSNTQMKLIILALTYASEVSEREFDKCLREIVKETETFVEHIIEKIANYDEDGNIKIIEMMEEYIIELHEQNS